MEGSGRRMTGSGNGGLQGSFSSSSALKLRVLRNFKSFSQKRSNKLGMKTTRRTSRPKRATRAPNGAFTNNVCRILRKFCMATLPRCGTPEFGPWSSKPFSINSLESGQRLCAMTRQGDEPTKQPALKKLAAMGAKSSTRISGWIIPYYRSELKSGIPAAIIAGARRRNQHARHVRYPAPLINVS
jgi:hypothetical protein